MLCGFQMAINHTWGSLLGNGLDRTKYNMCCQITLCYWWPLRSLKLTLCWSMWISSNLINTWNLKFRNKNNRHHYIGNRVQVEFRQKIMIRRKKMKTVKYKNHKWRVLKMKNIGKILWSTQYWLLIYRWQTSLWVIIAEVRDLGCRDLKMVCHGYRLN
jgi:hypothetical protein